MNNPDEAIRETAKRNNQLARLLALKLRIWLIIAGLALLAVLFPPFYFF